MKISVKGPIISSNQQWIYDWLGMEATSPQKVNGEIAKAHGEALEVEINSGGGDIMAASEIYTALRGYAGGVNIHIVGLAASAASVIAMAGKCDMTPTGMMMIHNVSTSAEGDYRTMEHSAEVLKTANETIRAAYMAKTGMDEKKISAMMDAETWITAKRCVELGLIDGVMQFADAPLAAAYEPGMLDQTTIETITKMLKNRGAGISDAEAERNAAAAKLKFLNLKGMKA